MDHLEIGVYEGRSAMWMLDNVLTAPDSTLTAIDLFDGDHFPVSLSNLIASGGAGKTTILGGPSQKLLRELPLETYEVIYIDGSHLAVNVLIDAVLSWQLLAQGGILIFDDYLWKLDEPASAGPKIAVDAFVSVFADRLQVVHSAYQMVVRKTAP